MRVIRCGAQAEPNEFRYEGSKTDPLGLGDLNRTPPKITQSEFVFRTRFEEREKGKKISKSQ